MAGTIFTARSSSLSAIDRAVDGYPANDRLLHVASQLVELRQCRVFRESPSHLTVRGCGNSAVLLRCKADDQPNHAARQDDLKVVTVLHEGYEKG